MGQNSSIEVRRVTVDDYEKVIAIRDPDDILDGKDYLSYSFHELIKSPQNEGFSAVIGGKFVAFALVTLVNDKTTIVMKSVRVHKSYSGRGIVRTLIQWIFRRYYLEMQVKRCWFASSQEYIFRNIQNGSLKLVTIRKYAAFYGDVSSIIPQDISDNLDLCVINPSQLDEIFRNDDIRQKLFPSDCLVWHWDPYTPIPANIPLILTDKTLILGSKMEDEESMILSCGSWIKAKVDSYFVNIYGNAKRTEDLYDHVITHINTCKYKINGASELRVSVDGDVDLTCTYKLFKRFNVPTHFDPVILIIAEKNLEINQKS